MYFVAAIGFIFHITNTLLLFKLSVYLMLLIYLIGVYLFANENYTNLLSKLIVCILAVCSIVWLKQFDFNLSIFYLIPFILYCFISYLNSCEMKWIYYSIILFEINFFGNVPYLMILEFYLLLIISCSLLLNRKLNGKRILPYRFARNEIWLLLFALGLFLALITLMREAKLNIINISPLRNIDDFTITLTTFLEYGRLSPGTAIFGYLTGAIPLGDNSYYIGLGSLLLFFLGIFIVDIPVFFSLTLGVIFIWGISIGGYWSIFCFYLPGMNYFRHISLFFGLSGCLMILSIGFVIDKLYTIQSVALAIKKNYYKLTLALILIFSIFFDAYLHYQDDDIAIKFWTDFDFWHSYFFMRILCYLYAGIFAIITFCYFPKIERKLYILALSIIMLFDIFSYQASLFAFIPNFKSYPVEISQTNKMEFIPQRRNAQPPRGYEFVTNKLNQFAIYTETLYPFVLYDPCYSPFRTNLLTKKFYLSLKKYNAINKAGIDFVNSHILTYYAKDLACNNDKLTLNQSSSSEIKLVNFNANKIDLWVNNTDKYDAIFSYADAFHPHWRAFIDDSPAKLSSSDLGLKQLTVARGKHHVVLRYGNLLDWFASYYLMVGGLIFVIVIIGQFGLGLMRDWHKKS